MTTMLSDAEIIERSRFHWRLAILMAKRIHQHWAAVHPTDRTALRLAGSALVVFTLYATGVFFALP